jgi:NAD-dependent deacetylase
MDQDLKDFAALIDAADRIVLFTGAGISTESGIPDFRSPGGVWTKQTPIDFSDFMRSDNARRETWRRRFEMEPVLRQAAPNRGHRAVAELIRSGKAACVITQNIDGLHQDSGIPDDKVIELHGNTTYARCIGCGHAYDFAWVKQNIDETGSAPDCSICGEPVKTATISFGQPMPEDAMRRAAELAKACDLFIAIGSSLVVWPAAGFPLMAKNCGARLVIINNEPTEQDYIADLVIRHDIGETLAPFVGN